LVLVLMLVRWCWMLGDLENYKGRRNRIHGKENKNKRRHAVRAKRHSSFSPTFVAPVCSIMNRSIQLCARRQLRLKQLLNSSSFSTAPAVATSTSLYPKLLEPLDLGPAGVLKNRVLMGSMHTGLEEPPVTGGFLGFGGTHGDLSGMAEFYAERARGEVGLIVTGGISPNDEGKGYFGAAKLSTDAEAEKHKIVTQAVHDAGGKIAMQILHTGRYGYHFNTVSASAIKAPIGWTTPKGDCC
jgi:hypothetical protein